MNSIILYTIGCPKCHQLERRLNERGIKYETCTDINQMKALGIKTAPVLAVNGVMMSFTQAWQWATKQEVK